MGSRRLWVVKEGIMKRVIEKKAIPACPGNGTGALQGGGLLPLPVWGQLLP